MAKGTKHRSATMRWSRFATIAALIVATLPLVPAVWINAQGTWSRGPGWVAFACAMPILSALFVEQARKSKLGWGIIYIFLAMLMVVGSLLNALINRTTDSDHRSDHRKTAIIAAKNASSQRSQWSQGRAEQSQIAGEASPEAIESDMQRFISANAQRWRQTQECNPEYTTGKMLRDWCSEVAGFKSKVAAARKRDELDAKLAKLEEKTDGQTVVTSVDPFADSIATGLTAMGYDVSDDLKALLGKGPDWVMAFLLEVMAAFGPGAVWSLLMVRRHDDAIPETPSPAERPVARKPIADAAPVASAAVQPPAVALDDPFHVFVGTRLERHADTWMPAGQPWDLWREFCAEKGIAEGSQKAFGCKMKTVFSHDKNNNRPRYMGVRARSTVIATQPNIRLAVVN